MSACREFAYILTLGIFDDYDIIPDIEVGMLVLDRPLDIDVVGHALADLAASVRHQYKQHQWEKPVLSRRHSWPEAAEFWSCETRWIEGECPDT